MVPRPEKPTRRSTAQRIEIRRQVQTANDARQREIDLRMRATKIHLALEQIDAALLSGDDFADPQARAELLSYLQSWTRVLGEPATEDAQAPQDDNAQAPDAPRWIHTANPPTTTVAQLVQPVQPTRHQDGSVSYPIAFPGWANPWAEFEHNGHAYKIEIGGGCQSIWLSRTDLGPRSDRDAQAPDIRAVKIEIGHVLPVMIELLDGLLADPSAAARSQDATPNKDPG